MTERYDADGQAQQDIPNRGYDNKLDDSDRAPVNVSIMSIDETIIRYFTDTVTPTIVDNNIQVKVPIIYGVPEVWAQFRQKGVLRDPGSDKIQTPVIMIKRSSVSRWNEMSNPANKYVNMSWEAGWNRRMPYDQFTVLNGVKPSRQFRAVIVPDYVQITYDVILWTEFEEQMSELISQINVEGDEYWGTRNNFKFKVKIDEFSGQSDTEAQVERVIRTQFSMKVNAYLVPERVVKNFKVSQNDIKSYSAKKMVVFIETESKS